VTTSAVELTAELQRITRTAVACCLDKIDPAKDMLMTLIEAMPRILPALPERLSKSAEDLLRGLDMDMLTGARVAAKSARIRSSLSS
jgi:NADH:ubiquinone reductase (H+-translocating)